MKTPEDVLNEVAAENMINIQQMVTTKQLAIIAMRRYAELYHNSEVNKFKLPDVIKSVCIAPKGECDRKPEDVCKECEGCKYLEQTVC